MTIHAGYLVDLRGVQFDDQTSGSWIHAMPLGEYDHPIHGRIRITPDRVKQFAANVAARVRDTDLDIDYEHKANGGEAAGWVRQAEARADGLWLFVEWTKTAFQKLKEGAYRYFSPEFVDEWKHPKKGVTYKDVLFGGGITNRPFLKDILPINMTEIVNASGGKSMDPAEVLKQLAKSLGLPEDTDPGVVLGHIQAKIGEGEGQGKSGEGQTGQTDEGQSQQSQQTVAADEGKAQGQQAKDQQGQGTVQLDEKAIQELPFVKTLMETVTAQGKKLDEAAVNEAVIQLSDKARAKNVAIPPVVRDGLKKQLSELPPTSRDGVIKLFESMIDNGQIGVSLNENGNAGHEQQKTAVKALNDAVDKAMQEKKLSYADAVTIVASENPSLYTEYQRELAGA